MKKNFKKSKFVILPALATLVLTGVASVTGTVAWFTANRAVTVSGMSFTAKSGSNLLIAADTLTNGIQLADSNFASTMTQSITGDLNPASTVDAKNFFYTNSAMADGKKESGDYTAVTTKPEDYYKDYIFELKAINTDDSEQNIYVNELDIKYAAKKTDGDGYEEAAYAANDLANAVKSFRAAFFIEKAKSKGFNLGTANDKDDKAVSVKSIYASAGAENQTANNAVNSTTTVGNVTYVSTQTALATVEKNSTTYFKGICRIWLEGEDKNCNNEAFSTATGQWSVSLGLKLSTTEHPLAEDAVTNIKVAGDNQVPQQ